MIHCGELPSFFLNLNALALVVQRVDNAIQQINHYPVNSVVCFANTYPLDSDLSGGQRYTPFERLGPGSFNSDRLSDQNLLLIVHTHSQIWVVC